MQMLAIFIPAVDPGFDEAGNMIPGSFEGIMLMLLLVNVLLNLPVDLFSSVALFRIARIQGVQNPWLAWIPLGSLWVMGSIADQYQEQVRGRRSFLRWLLMLHMVCSGLLLYIVAFSSPLAAALEGLAVQYLLIPMILSIGGIVAVYIALHKVYKCSAIVDSEAFTILGVLFSLPTPFLLWHTAKKMEQIDSIKRWESLKRK